MICVQMDALGWARLLLPLITDPVELLRCAAVCRTWRDQSHLVYETLHLLNYSTEYEASLSAAENYWRAKHRAGYGYYYLYPERWAATINELDKWPALLGKSCAILAKISRKYRSKTFDRAWRKHQVRHTLAGENNSCITSETFLKFKVTAYKPRTGAVELDGFMWAMSRQSFICFEPCDPIKICL